jgi:hypothetical protein
MVGVSIWALLAFSQGIILMLIKVKLSALAQGHWYEYFIRFILGGFATVLTGLIAARWGPVVGGLFLAFPAIFPASATLVEKHEREKKEKANLRGDRRGREAAALEAAGAVLGSLGLIAFGAAIWQIVHLYRRRRFCHRRISLAARFLLGMDGS